MVFASKMGEDEHPISLIILLMEEIPSNHLGCIKPCKSWDRLPTSTGEFTGFLNHQPYCFQSAGPPLLALIFIIFAKFISLEQQWVFSTSPIHQQWFHCWNQESTTCATKNGTFLHVPRGCPRKLGSKVSRSVAYFTLYPMKISRWNN